MKKKKLRKFKEIARVKNNIYRMFPHANDVTVKIDEVGGKYESLIKVHIPPKKNLIAFKADNSFKGSLEKSYHAMVRQIHKVKTRYGRAKLRDPEVLIPA